jgi:hypothetical protein
MVQVRVFEHGEEPQVTFPPDALLGPETDHSVISEVAQRGLSGSSHCGAENEKEPTR